MMLDISGFQGPQHFYNNNLAVRVRYFYFIRSFYSLELLQVLNYLLVVQPQVITAAPLA